MIRLPHTFDTYKPETPAGCLWYFLGFCVFAILFVALVKWMF
jgi:hypothetical protein